LLSLPALPPPTLEKSDSAFRSHRLRNNRRYLGKLLTKVLSSLRDVVVLGDDPLVSYAVKKAGTDAEDIVVRQVLVADMPITILGVPRKIWFRSARMARLQRAQRLLGKLGRRCVVIPQTAFDGLGDDAAARVMDAALHISDVPADKSCPSHHRHDPVGCFAHLLATGLVCEAR
jgi:hypothetical protein